MAFFCDMTGTEWTVDINLGTARRLRKDDIDLLDTDTVNKYLSDPIEMFNLLYLVCEPQCQKLNISDEEFGARLGQMSDKGYVAEVATNLMIEAIQDFFTQAGRPAMRSLVKTTWTAATKAQQKSMDMISGAKCQGMIDSLMDKAMIEADAKLTELLGETSTK